MPDLQNLRLAYYQSQIGVIGAVNQEIGGAEEEYFRRYILNGSSIDANGVITFQNVTLDINTFGLPVTFTANATFAANVSFAAGVALGNTVINGTLTANGNATVNGTFLTQGATTVNNSLTVNGASALGNTVINGTLLANGAVTANGTLLVKGVTTINAALSVNANSTLGNTVINGATVANGALSANGDATVTGNLTVSGTISGSGLVPTGTVVQFAGSAAPSGWYLCDGSSYAKATDSALFAVVGTTYGAGNTTHFVVPDTRGRFALGKSTAGTGSTLGASGGSLGHTHASNTVQVTIPAHSHTVPGLSIPALTVASHTHVLTDHIHGQPAHVHTFSVTSGAAGNHTHGFSGTTGSNTTFFVGVDGGGINNVPLDGAVYPFSGTTDAPGDHTHGVSGTTSSSGSDNTNGIVGGAPATGAASPSTGTGTTGTGTSGTTALTSDILTPGVTGGADPAYLVFQMIVKR